MSTDLNKSKQISLNVDFNEHKSQWTICQNFHICRPNINEQHIICETLSLVHHISVTTTIVLMRVSVGATSNNNNNNNKIRALHKICSCKHKILLNRPTSSQSNSVGHWPRGRASETRKALRQEESLEPRTQKCRTGVLPCVTCALACSREHGSCERIHPNNRVGGWATKGGPWT